MSLDTGRKIHRRQWTKLPISDDVITRINELASKEKQPIVSINFRYTWDKNSERDIINDDDYDSEIEAVLDHDMTEHDDHNDIRLQEMDVLEDNDEQNDLEENNDEGEQPQIVTHDDSTDNHEVMANNEDDGTTMFERNENDDPENIIAPSDDETEVDNHTSSMNETQLTNRSGLRSGTRINYASLHKYGESQLNQIHKKLMKKNHKKGCLRGKSSIQKKHF